MKAKITKRAVKADSGLGGWVERVKGLRLSPESAEATLRGARADGLVVMFQWKDESLLKRDLWKKHGFVPKKVVTGRRAALDHIEASGGVVNLWNVWVLHTKQVPAAMAAEIEMTASRFDAKIATPVTEEEIAAVKAKVAKRYKKNKAEAPQG